MDPVAELIVAEAGALLEPVAVLEDRGGELTRHALGQGLTVSAWCDDARDTAALPPGAAAPSLAESLQGARTVLWRLPASVSAVQDYAEHVARFASPQVRVFAGARVKHLAGSMNDALNRSFTHVSASLGARKSRVLRAAGPRPDAPATWPRTRPLPALALSVAARGGTFNTTRLDAGTALLIGCFDRLPPAGRAVDLGCGSGIMATLLARRGWRTTATDVSAMAVESARLTAAANGVVVDVVQGVGLAAIAGPVDLIVCNPPFHRGAAKDSTPTREMFAAAPAVLATDGEFWTVFNSHLPYLGWLREAVGPTHVLTRDRHYTVARSRPA